jgi:hypothetical protein
MLQHRQRVIKRLIDGAVTDDSDDSTHIFSPEKVTLAAQDPARREFFHPIQRSSGYLELSGR